MNLLDRPEVLDDGLWYHDNARTVIYRNIDGASPEITNHVSRVKFEVISGVGRIATPGMFADVEAGDCVTVMPEMPHIYLGKMSFLTTISPRLLPAFVTFNGEPLPKEEAKILKQAKKKFHREEQMSALVSKIISDYEEMIKTMLYFHEMNEFDHERPLAGQSRKLQSR